MTVVEPPSFHHGLLEGFLNDDDRGSGRFLIASRVTREEAEEGPEIGGSPGVVFELQIDVPESALMADGCQVMPCGGGRV
jgi:hypothetical protein